MQKGVILFPAHERKEVRVSALQGRSRKARCSISATLKSLVGFDETSCGGLQTIRKFRFRYHNPRWMVPLTAQVAKVAQNLNYSPTTFLNFLLCMATMP